MNILMNPSAYCSLRAQFGSDVKANALHGSSTVESAKEIITRVFGGVEFDKTGNVDTGEILMNSFRFLHEPLIETCS